MTTITYYELPISDEIRSFISTWLPYQNEGPAMEIHDIVNSWVEECVNPYEYGLIRHLETIISVIYEYCDGFDYDGESYTPGLEDSDDGGFGLHIQHVTTQSMQKHVDTLYELWKMQRPNRLFG